MFIYFDRIRKFRKCNLQKSATANNDSANEIDAAVLTLLACDVVLLVTDILVVVNVVIVVTSSPPNGSLTSSMSGQLSKTHSKLFVVLHPHRGLAECLKNNFFPVNLGLSG